MKQDKELLKNRFSANLDNYAESAVVQREICSHLAGKISAIDTDSKVAVEIGAGTGFLTGHLFEMFPDSAWTVNDLVERSGEYISRIAGEIRYSYLCGDAEVINLPASDLVVSASTIQWFDDQPGFFHKTYDSLRPGGFFCFSTFGPDNFHEIKSCSGVGLEYYTVGELIAILRDVGFTVVDSEEVTTVLEFDSPLDVLRHIRTTGVNSIENVRWTRRELENFSEKYLTGFTTGDGKVTLTYHPLFIIARK